MRQQQHEETTTLLVPAQDFDLRAVRKPLQSKTQVEDIDSLLATLERENRHRKRASRFLPLFGVIYAVFLLAMLLLMWKLTGRFNGAFFAFYGLMGVMGALAVSENYKKAARQLAQLEDMRAVGAWAEALEVPDREVRQMARQALTKLLPALRPSDGYRLDAEQRRCLAAHLLRAAREEEVDFILLLLRALEQVGDSSAISFVEKMKGEGIAVKDTRIHEEADACLSVLAARKDQEQNQQTLLRGSHIISEAPETLLRSAEGTATVDPQQLLRADPQE